MARLDTVEWGGRKSTGWKDVTLRCHGTEEEIVLPVMISTTVKDIRVLLGAMLDLPDNGEGLTFMIKYGISLKRMRNHEEIRTGAVVKGIKTFAKVTQEYVHPYCIIGAGTFGLRQAMHYIRHKLDFAVIDRQPRVGGNAWVCLANDTSKLQSEGVHYQLQYDALDGNVKALKRDFPTWPKRYEVLSHFEEVLQDYGVMPHIMLDKNVVECRAQASPTEPLEKHHYNLRYESTKGDGLEGVFQCSTIAHYPGALVSPRVLTWPGEDDFGGQLAYGHGNLFDYSKIAGEKVVIVGMGAFANENIRTCLEFGVGYMYQLVRSMNVLLPRCVCWFINQSMNAPPGPYVFDMMMYMYKVIGWDPWEMPGVIATKDRKNATLRQNSRWGTGDTFFIAHYFGKAEITVDEVKRVKFRTVVLMKGSSIREVDHLMKCIGFQGDFSVDALHKTKKHYGFWPDNDWRRFIYCEFLNIDAGRFGGTAFAPGGASAAAMCLWYFQHPRDVQKQQSSGTIPTRVSQPEKGFPAYYWDGRSGSMIQMAMGAGVPELTEFEMIHNMPFKKSSIWHLQPPEVHVQCCREDWEHYCQLLTDQGSDRPWPPYPYTAKILEEYCKMEENLGNTEGRDTSVDAATRRELYKATYGTQASFEPAILTLRARSRSTSRNPSKKQQLRWLAEAKQTFPTSELSLKIANIPHVDEDHDEDEHAKQYADPNADGETSLPQSAEERLKVRCAKEAARKLPHWVPIGMEQVTANSGTVSKGMFYGIEFPWSEQLLVQFGPRWLTKAFHIAGTLEKSNSVTKIILERKIKVTAGNNAGKFLFEVEYAMEDANLHTKLFAKIPFPLTKETKSDRLSSSVYKQPMDYNEINAYRLFEASLPVTTPKYYFGDISNSSTNFILITARIPFAEITGKLDRVLEPFEIEGPYDKCMDLYQLRSPPKEYYSLLMRMAARIAGARKEISKISTEVMNIALNTTRTQRHAFRMDEYACTGEDPKTFSQKLNTATKFFSETAKILYPDYVTTDAFQIKFHRWLMATNAYMEEIQYYKHGEDLKYTSLGHCNLNIDNAYFWRDENGELDCGVFDWGGFGMQNLGRVIWWILNCAEFDQVKENYWHYLDTFISTLQECGGATVDREVLSRMVMFTALENVIFMIAAIPNAIKMCPIREWATIQDRRDPRIWENVDGKSTLRTTLHVLNTGLRIVEEMKADQVVQDWIKEVYVGKWGRSRKSQEVIFGHRSSKEG